MAAPHSWLISGIAGETEGERLSRGGVRESVLGLGFRLGALEGEEGVREGSRV